MADKKERQVISASTGTKTTGKPKQAVVSAENKSKATNKRLVAIILWVLGLAAEIAAILLINGTIFIDTKANPNLKLILLIGAIVVDAILVIIGSQLWKGANRLDPVSEKNKLKFFLWNQMGVIAAIVCFLPMIIFLLTQKDLDAKTKKITTIVAAIVLIIVMLFSIDFNPVSSEDLADAQELAGEDQVYWTQFGHKYHLYDDCQSLTNSTTLYTGTVEEAFEAKRTDICAFCAKRAEDNKNINESTDENTDEVKPE